jgi:hypothetical protein
MKYQVVSEAGIETTRTDRSTAEADVSILRWLGKKATIVEVPK